MAPIITGNVGLKELWIGGNNLQSGIMHVAKLCMDLPNLKILELSRNNCSAPVVADLVSVAKNILSLRALLFGGMTLNKTEYFVAKFYESQSYSIISHHDDSVLLETIIVMQKYLLTYHIKFSHNWSYQEFCTNVEVL